MTDSTSRRGFIEQVGQIGLGAAVVHTMPPSTRAGDSVDPASARAASEWDMSWIADVKKAPSRAVFDSTGGDFVLQSSVRYLDNFDVVYPSQAGKARAVIVLRVRAIAMGFNDDAWKRYPLAAEGDVRDEKTKELLQRNPYTDAARAGTMMSALTLDKLHARHATILVCDFAMGHLADRLAKKSGESPDDVHAALRRMLVPGAYAMPSGLFALAAAQNAGCAFVPGG